jgi:acyl carrier protein
MTRAALTAWEIQDWLVGRITATLRLTASEVTPESVFSELGLSSVQGVQLAADLEDWCGCEIPATFLYECPTIEDAAAYVVDRTAPRLSLSQGGS